MRQVCLRPRFASRGIGLLIELLVVIVIIAALTGMYFGFRGHGGEATGGATGDGYTPGDRINNGQPAQSLPGRVLQKAEGVECQSNLRQLRALIEAEKATDGATPASLANLPEAAGIGKCPVGGEEYTYDPSTGAVRCPHAGHERF